MPKIQLSYHTANAYKKELRRKVLHKQLRGDRFYELPDGRPAYLFTQDKPIDFKGTRALLVQVGPPDPDGTVETETIYHSAHVLRRCPMIPKSDWPFYWYDEGIAGKVG